MSSFTRASFALLLLSLLCRGAPAAQVRVPTVADTPRVLAPLPTITRPPVQVPDSIVVPEVVGQSVALAVRRMMAAGLRPVSVDSTPVAAPTPGIVVGQSPKGGSRVARGSPGEVSVGVAAPAPPPQELVPSLVGMTMPEAQRVIVERKLRLVDVDTFPREGGSGRVAAQNPGGGSPMPRDRAISLSVTVPPPTFAMPNLGGQSLPRARAIVSARGLVLALVDSVRREGGDHTVVDQKPAAGEPVQQGERVAVILSVPTPPPPVVPPTDPTGPPPAGPDPGPFQPVDPAPTPTGPVEPGQGPAQPADAGPTPGQPGGQVPTPGQPVDAGPPATSPQAGTPVVPQPGQAPLPQPTATPTQPVTPTAPGAAARVDTVPVPAEPRGSPVPWILLGLLLLALLVAAAFAGRQRLEAGRERSAFRLALQAGPPTVRIAPKRHPDTQDLHVPGALFSGPAIRILPRLDQGEVRLVVRTSPTTREDRS